MAYELRLPDLGEGLVEGEVARWLVRVGDEVAEDDPLVEIATDKATVEIPSPAAGVVLELRVPEGAVVPVGTVLAVVGTRAERPPAPPPSASSAADVRATPLVRRLARDLGVELAGLAGSGVGGSVTEHDVRAAADSAAADRAERRIPLRGIRRRSAEHLATAHREIPAVTFVEECDFTGADLALLVPRALQAAAQALRRFPELNARLEGDEIVLVERYDLGVAVQTDEGLVVPVVRGCDTASLEQLAAEVARLAEGARAGTLAPGELRGSTFTVTSAGRLGGLLATPLVNHPEVAILGLHRIAPRPVVRDGKVVVREIGNVSVTFDHRVVDGARAAAFCLDVIAALETTGVRSSSFRGRNEEDLTP